MNLLMLTMSSSGSKWLARAIARHLPDCHYYDKEFFNPVCNLKHEVTLRRHFGSELACCFDNIASPGDACIHDVIRETWGRENYTFTKECFSPFKLPVFVEHFKCFVLLRRTDDCFPPLRLRVWSFYEHAWQALKNHGHPMTAVNVVERALEAHSYIYRHIESEATRLGVPILRFEDMMDDGHEAIMQKIRSAVGYASVPMAEEIVSTRYREPRREE